MTKFKLSTLLNPVWSERVTWCLLVLKNQDKGTRILMHAFNPRQRQEHLYELQDSLVYMESSRTGSTSEPLPNKYQYKVYFKDSGVW